MPSRLSRLAPGALAVLAVLTLTTSYDGTEPAAATTGPHGSLVVEGYVVGWGGGAAAYRTDRGVVDEAGVDGIELTAGGDGVTQVPAPARKVLRSTHRHHDAAELLVSNYSDALGDFDPDRAHALLDSAAHRRRVAADLARIALRQGWDGIQLDLESLRLRDGRGLARLVDRLRLDLPSGVSLSMAVIAESSRAAYHRHGYALGRLGEVDRFVLMAYDQHGPGWSGPGPVGALPWARRTAGPLVAAVGPDRVDLGIAGYGYVWRPDGTGRTVSDATARALAGSAAVWHATVAEWSARIARATLWWSDHRSYNRRVALAGGLGLHGVAVWQLGSSDPLAG